ncbi:MAG: GNAT family N-acetyltransferase [Magnetospirillum sp.]|nr:GNAT family N-acetyltransferase [Magnetospirillum sp.]
MSGQTFQERVTRQLGSLKRGPFGSEGLGSGALRLFPVTADFLEDSGNVAMLADWRQNNLVGFPRHQKITVEGTVAWGRAQLIERPDRILMMIRENDSPLVGHVGLSNFDFAAGSCEFDNVIRGDKQARKGVMGDACRVLIDWAYGTLGVSRLWLRTFLDNLPAITLYYRSGFRVRSIAPLIRVESPGQVEFLPAPSTQRIDRFDIVMEHERG